MCLCKCNRASLHFYMCFHKARPYKALANTVLSIETGAGMQAQHWAAFLRAGCGLTPTKFPKQSNQEGGIVGGRSVLSCLK